MKTKQKLLTGLLAPTSLVVACSSLALAASCKVTSDSSKTKFLNPATIKFSAGDGEFVNNKNHNVDIEAGTTLDRIPQPMVKSKKSNKIFAGWADENGDLVGNKTINKDTKLTATYNAYSSEYATVTFAKDPTQTESGGPVLQGNQQISVNKGYYFFMVNRPTATWKVERSGVTKEKYFKGWRLSTSASTTTVLSENYVISGNVTLYPVFNEAVTVRWEADGQHTEGTPTGRGDIQRGQETTTLETNTEFNKFNQPALQYIYDPTTHTDNAYWAGWQTRTGSGTSEDPYVYTDMDPSTLINEDITVYAKWSKEPKIGDKYTDLSFQDPNPIMADGTTYLPTTMVYSWTPSDKIIVQLNDQTWGNTNKPSIVCYEDSTKQSITTNYKIASWEISTDSGSTWTALSDATTFTTQHIQVRPVLTYAIDSIKVYSTTGVTSVKPESTLQCAVQVTGGATSTATNYTWGLYTDPTDTSESSRLYDGIAQISNSGLITVKSISRETYAQHGCETFYVRATSKLDSTKTDALPVHFKMPYEDNMNIWIYTSSSESSSPKWYYANAEDFTKGQNVTAHTIDGLTTHTFAINEDFTDTITFGSELGAVPDGFLWNWTNFKGNIDFANSNIIKIGNGFMYGCTSFNNQLTGLDRIMYIGSDFMSYCTSFNQPITFSSNSQLVEIGENFLGFCTAFNSVIRLPDLTGLNILNNFLNGCTSFNQNLSLWSGIQHIGTFFMANCNAFTSTLTVNCSADVISYDDYSLASIDENAAIYTTGFSIDGTEATGWKNIFVNLSGPDSYRTISAAEWTGEVTQAELEAGVAEMIAATDYTMNMATEGYSQTIKFSKNSSNTSNDDPEMYDEAELISVDGSNDSSYGIFYNNYKGIAGLEVQTSDALGTFYSFYTDDTGSRASSEPKQMFLQLRSIFEYMSDFTFDPDARGYIVNMPWSNTEERYVIQFDKNTKKINNFIMQISSDGVTWTSASIIGISNIGTTTITSHVDTVKHFLLPTWNSTDNEYTATDTDAFADGDTGGVYIPIKDELSSLQPDAFICYGISGTTKKPMSNINFVRGSSNISNTANAHPSDDSETLAYFDPLYDTEMENQYFMNGDEMGAILRSDEGTLGANAVYHFKPIESTDATQTSVLRIKVAEVTIPTSLGTASPTRVMICDENVTNYTSTYYSKELPIIYVTQYNKPSEAYTDTYGYFSKEITSDYVYKVYHKGWNNQDIDVEIDTTNGEGGSYYYLNGDTATKHYLGGSSPLVTYAHSANQYYGSLTIKASAFTTSTNRTIDLHLVFKQKTA